jgi:hypothetical protein
MTTLKILKAARARITDPARWTTGLYARDAAGIVVTPDDPKAVCWCAIGSLLVEVAGTPSRETPIGRTGPFQKLSHMLTFSRCTTLRSIPRRRACRWTADRRRNERPHRFPAEGARRLDRAARDSAELPQAEVPHRQGVPKQATHVQSRWRLRPRRATVSRLEEARQRPSECFEVIHGEATPIRTASASAREHRRVQRRPPVRLDGVRRCRQVERLGEESCAAAEGPADAAEEEERASGNMITFSDYSDYDTMCPACGKPIVQTVFDNGRVIGHGYSNWGGASILCDFREPW